MCPPVKTVSGFKWMRVFLLVTLVLPSLATAQETYQFERMWPISPQPWYFTWPEGIAVDSSGNVYVAETQNHLIQKFASDGQFITRWGGLGSADGQLNWPNGIAVDSADNVYVADTKNHRIQKFTSNGEFIAQWGSEGSGDGQFNQPEGIAVDSVGNMYVADTGNHRIQKFTSDGQFITRWGSLGSGDGQFNVPFDITVDSGGNVYVADCWNHRIQKFTSGGQFITQWGSLGSEDGQFEYPRGIAVDSGGNVYVADTKNHRIQKFTSGGQFITRWGNLGLGDGQFYEPFGITLDSGGNVHVVDRLNDRIQKFTSEGQFITQWRSWGSGDGQFNVPLGIAIDSGGNVYVADCWNDRIQKFTSEGQFVTRWGRSGFGEGQFYGPAGMAIDSGGNLYVADSGNARIQKFTSEGRFITQWGSYGTGSGQFDDPEGIAVDAVGNVYVTDRSNHRIQKFTSDGQFITQWGSQGEGEGQFHFPYGIAVDSGSHVYVVDWWNDRIQKFTSEGQFITQWGNHGSGDGQFEYPRGIAVDSGGNVYVADFGHNRIQKFTSDGQFLGKFGEFGFSEGHLNGAVYLAVAPDNRIYVSDSNSNRIQAFRAVQPVQRVDKAIIVAGGGPYPGNNLWDTTQMCANFAYRSLSFQGFTKETIYYLTHDNDLDLDGNGILDDVEGVPTNSALHQAITQWASDAKNLILYITDHGDENTFGMSATEILQASELDSWLDILQQSIPGKVVVVYDACYSGSFLDQLTPPPGKERIVTTSTSPDEVAYFLTQGTISFSNFFWLEVLKGSKLLNAFNLAKQAIELYEQINQTPLLDADGNGIGNEKNDQEKSVNETIGSGIITAANMPVIASVSPSQNMNGQNTATFWADVVTLGKIARVWAVILPPDYRSDSASAPITHLPTVDLKAVGGNRYEGTYNGFTAQGTYEISVYALDDRTMLSLPMKTTVTQEAGLTPIEIDSDAPQADVSFSPGQSVHLTLKAEPGQKIWILLQAPTILPGVEFARPSDAYCRQQGRWVFPFTGDTESLWYAKPCSVSRIDFGVNDFTGIGELVITIRKGESPGSLETIQTIRLTER